MSQEKPTYEQLKLKLAEIRQRHAGQESDEEDLCLDKMDIIWKEEHP